MLENSPAYRKGSYLESSKPDLSKLITMTVKNASVGREKPCSIVDSWELVSATDLYLDCSPGVRLLSGRASIRQSADRCFEQHLAKSKATAAKPLNSHQSRGQAQPIGCCPIQARPAFPHEILKTKSRLRSSWPAFLKYYYSALMCQHERDWQVKSTISGRIPLPRRPNVPFGC
jgi:hypothetical protein